MSFFIAYFPFDFECAKVRHFLDMAMLLKIFFVINRTTICFSMFYTFYSTSKSTLVELIDLAPY